MPPVTPHPSAVSVAPPPRPAWPARLVREAAWLALAAAASVATAFLTLRSPQLGATTALVVLALGLHIASRPAGLTVMWLVWLLGPWLRRVLGLAEDSGGADPLALLPFLVTGGIVAIELYRATLSRFAAGVLLVAAAGYAVGVPAGLGAPTSAAFALFAYLVAVGCFVIGYGERQGMDGLTLRRVLLVAAPPLALYAILQYVGPLMPWDQAWLQSVEGTLVSIGAPEAGHVRVFGTLNSPGTFAAVLGLAAVCFLTDRRLNALKVLGVGLVIAALLLTFVRSAWVSAVAALLVVVVGSRGGASIRVLLIGGAVVVALAIVAGRGQTGQSIVGRAGTLTSLHSDVSARQRVATPQQFLPQALGSPLGTGIGSTGEASRLAAASALRATDNGYLSLIVQVGPFGFLLVIAAIAASVLRAVGNLVRHHSDPVDVLVLGLLGFFAVGMLGGDLMYGVTGMVLWYLLGVGVRRSEGGASTWSD